MKHIDCEKQHLNVLRLKQTDEYSHAEKACTVDHEKYWLNQAHMTQAEINTTDDRLLKIRIETAAFKQNEYYKGKAMDNIDESVRLNQELEYCLNQQDREDLSGPTYHELMDEERQLRKDITMRDNFVDAFNKRIDWSL